MTLTVANQTPAILLESSSNFKAIEGFSFDITCVSNAPGKSSFEFILPSSKKAESSDLITIRQRWEADAMELRITKAVKTRDEGSYECIVNGSKTLNISVEFVSKPFLKLSTKNVHVRSKKNEDAIIEVDISSLPFPTFLFFDSFKHHIEIENIRSHQVSPNTLKLRYPYNERPMISNLTLTARYENCVDRIIFQLVTEGEYRFMKVSTSNNFTSPPDIPTLEVQDHLKYGGNMKSSWKESANLSSFVLFERDEPDRRLWADDTKSRLFLTFKSSSAPLASAIAWMFQPSRIKSSKNSVSRHEVFVFFNFIFINFGLESKLIELGGDEILKRL